MRRSALAAAGLFAALSLAEAAAQPVGPRGTHPSRHGPPAANTALVAQDGSGNAAGIVQRGRELSAAIVQEGDANTACVQQVGRGHAALVTQRGDGQAVMVLQTPARQRVWEGADAAARARRVCGF